MDETYICKKCEYKIDDLDSVKRYVYCHSGNGDFKLHPLCPICGHGMQDLSENVAIV